MLNTVTSLSAVVNQLTTESLAVYVPAVKLFTLLQNNFSNDDAFCLNGSRIHLDVKTDRDARYFRHESRLTHFFMEAAIFVACVKNGTENVHLAERILLAASTVIQLN